MSSLLTQNIEECCHGLKPHSYKQVSGAGDRNAVVICDYIKALRIETFVSDNYRKSIIGDLSRLSRFFNNDKKFESIQREDIISFLNKYRKSDEEDPMHKWIGTYNITLVRLIRFFKWLYYPHEDPKQRSKPAVLRNIGKLKRREQSTYKPSDLWTEQDDELFLKYCKSKRLKCYHMVSRDTSARPRELTKLKIGDIQFRQNADGTQYAETLVNDKTGTISKPLFNSIPYVKDYLDHEHPCPTNLKAPFLSGTGKAAGKHLEASQIDTDYRLSKKRFASKILNNPNTPIEDKQKITELLRKPWNPYIRRHTALTEKAANPMINAILEHHAGWVEGSSMKKKYVHYFANKSNNSILEAYGILPQKSSELKLRVKQCPQCNEPNVPDAKFCGKCRMVLRYDGYKEVKEKEKERENKMQALEAQVKELSHTYNTISQAVDVNIEKICDMVQKGIFKRISEEEFNNTKFGGIKIIGKEVIEGKVSIRDRIFLVPVHKKPAAT